MKIIPLSIPAETCITSSPCRFLLVADRKRTNFFFLLRFLAFFLAFTFTSNIQAQTINALNNEVPIKDVMDVLRSLFHIRPDSSSANSKPALAVLPTLGYNPSFGFVIGANATMGKQIGDPATTSYSILSAGVLYSSKGIFTAQIRHNIFKEDNLWNFQGNWQLSLYGLVDYSLGTGKDEYCYGGLNFNDYPTTTVDSAFPVTYNYVRLLEKAYRKIGDHTFIGAGISIDHYAKIDDIKLTDTSTTPHYRYSLKHGFDPEKYSANGLIVAFQYNTREHPIRSYGGIYFDFSIRLDQKLLGSTENSIQLIYDFRKYWSLSKRNPEHVFAIWHWANYKLSGDIPYLELPYTGSDTYNRSGRAYTIGRFRGPSYGCFEAEYRYPILRNKLISGVCFLNAQSASDDRNQHIYSKWNAGGGIGFRILFQKKNRAAVCVDFSKGNCGSSGIFFGLNEVF